MREVGRGGMGIVYEARQVSLGRRVAVKVLPSAGLLDARQLQRFQNEARAAAQLNHPHIVDCFCVGCDDGVHYFAMRFIEGRTLAEVIADESTAFRVQGSEHGSKEEKAGDSRDQSSKTQDQRPKTSIQNPKSKIQNRKSAEWIAQAAEALEHAHASGVVHRDIKPSNLLVDNDGKLWVTDFGVARFGDDAALTFTGDLLGTLRYMSPEQALGRLAAIGPRSDVYSLGATLYELLGSRPVFGGEDRGELLRQVAFERPTALRKAAPRLPRDLETIAHKALEKSPEDRYATAGEMAADLRRFLRGEPIRAKPPTLAQLTTKWCLRHRGVVASAAAILLLAVAGLLTSTLLISRSRDDAVAAQKVAEDRDRENRRMLSIIETGLAMQAYQQGDLNRAKELLERQGSRIRENSGSTTEDGLPSPSRQKGDRQGSRIREQSGEDSPVGNRPTSHEAGYDAAPIENPKSKIQNPDGGFAWHWLRQAVDARCPELKSFDGHPGEVYEVDYSPDGTLLAAACDRHIILRDATTGEIRHEIAAHRSDLNSVDFSPDGKLLASVGDDHRVRLWDVPSGKLAADLGSHDCEAVSAAFSPDGLRLATGDDHGLIILWDVPNRHVEKRLVGHEGKVDSLAFAADGRLVSVSADGHMIAWDVDVGKPLWKVQSPHSEFIPVVVSPDRETVATGDHLGVVGLWSLADGRPVGRLGMRNRILEGLAFSPDGKLLAAGGHEGTAQIWDMRTQTFLGETGKHKDRLWSVAFSPDSRVLATGSRDGSVKDWDIENTRQPRRLFAPRAEIRLAFSEDSRTLAAACDSELWLWPRGAAHPGKLALPAELTKRVYLDPDHEVGPFAAACVAWLGNQLVLQDSSGSLWLANADGDCRPWIERRGARAKGYSLSPDRRWLALLTTRGVTELWNVERMEIAAEPSKRHRLPLFSPDSSSFYTCRDARLMRWPLRSPGAGAPPLDKVRMRESVDVFGLEGDLDPLGISRDGQTLLLSFTQLLDLPSLRTTPLVGHHAAINCASLSPDGRTLATGGMDGTVSLWDVGMAQEVCTLERRTEGEIGAVAFSPDGRSLAACGRDRAGGSVTLWELK